MRNLILTTIHRLPARSLEPFFASLRRTAYSGEVVVFASSISPGDRAQIHQWGASIVPFHFLSGTVRNRLASPWSLWRRIFASATPWPLKKALAHAVFHLFYRRHLLYLDYLQNSAEKYHRVFLTDCRDVIFQTDPFAWNSEPGLHVFLEEEKQKLGTCPFHIRWFHSLFGPTSLGGIEDAVVSCAGTVFGDQLSIENYLQEMVRLTMQTLKMSAVDGDQGVHNYFLRKTNPSGVTIHRNREGPILTMGCMSPDDCRLDESKALVDAFGSPYPVLHQYDRIPQLEKLLLARLADHP